MVYESVAEFTGATFHWHWTMVFWILAVIFLVLAAIFACRKPENVEKPMMFFCIFLIFFGLGIILGSGHNMYY